MAATGRGELRGRGEERERNSKRPRLECSPLGQVREAPSKQSRTDRDFDPGARPRLSYCDASPDASSSSSTASSSALVRTVSCTLDFEASGCLFKPPSQLPSPVRPVFPQLLLPSSPAIIIHQRVDRQVCTVSLDRTLAHITAADMDTPVAIQVWTNSFEIGQLPTAIWYHYDGMCSPR